MSLSGALAACSSDDEAEPAEPVTADACVVTIHGKSERGRETVIVDGVADVRPNGNDSAGSGRQWIYFPSDRLDEARRIVEESVARASCRDVVIHGFSNGGAFAAKLYCTGSDLGGTLRGVIVDDPVTDDSTQDCAPVAGIPVALYWTGALESDAPPGTSCESIGWTCDGPQVRGVVAFAEALGVEPVQSPNREHIIVANPPEVRRWLG